MSHELRNSTIRFLFWITVLFVLLMVLMCYLMCQLPVPSTTEEREGVEPTTEEVAVRPEASPRPRPRARDAPRPEAEAPRDEKPVPAEALKEREAAPSCPSTPVPRARMRYAYEMLIERIKTRNETTLSRSGSVEFRWDYRTITASPSAPVGIRFHQFRSRTTWIGDVETGCLTHEGTDVRGDEMFVVSWDQATGETRWPERHAEAQAELSTLVDALIADLEARP